MVSSWGGHFLCASCTLFTRSPHGVADLFLHDLTMRSCCRARLVVSGITPPAGVTELALPDSNVHRRVCFTSKPTRVRRVCANRKNPMQWRSACFTLGWPACHGKPASISRQCSSQQLLSQNARVHTMKAKGRHLSRPANPAPRPSSPLSGSRSHKRHLP
jgi:hypothetical protein